MGLRSVTSKWLAVLLSIERKITVHFISWDRLPACQLGTTGWKLTPIIFRTFLTYGITLVYATMTFGQDPGQGVAPNGDVVQQKNMLTWLIESLGWFYILIFLALSFIFFAFLIMNILAARRDFLCPQHLIEAFEAHLDQKQYQEAYELAKADDSFLGNVLSSGLARLSGSYKHAMGAMQEVGEEESLKLDHRLSYLALIATISPMIGLFGTVHGMISSFQVIAFGGTAPDPSKLANGISTALLTTLIGLAIAIPAIAAFNILRNRIQWLVLEVGITSERLMSRFEKVGTNTKTE